MIDSIIRQSRHQFGFEKDVFAPRFARNIQNTFMHLYKCPEEEKVCFFRFLNYELKYNLVNFLFNYIIGKNHSSS